MIRRLSCGVVLLPLAACNATAVDSASQRNQPNGAEWEVFDLGGDMIVVPSEPDDDDEVDVTEVDVTETDVTETDTLDRGSYELQWVYQWDSAHADDVTDLAMDGQGGVVAAIQTWNVEASLESDEGWSHTLMRLDASGQVVWSASPEEAKHLATPERVAVAPNGDIYGVGVSDGDPSDLSLTRFNALGVPQWIYEWGSDGTDTPTAVDVDEAGNVLVGGKTEGTLSGQTEGEGGAFLTMFDDAGEILWQRQFGVEDESVTTIAFHGDGGVVVGTVRYLHAGTIDSFVRGFDSSGDVIWTQDWATPDVGFDAMVLDEAGTIVLGGRLDDGAGFAKPALAKLDGRGEVTWFDTWEGDGSTRVRGVAALADGGIALATTSSPGGSSAEWSGIVIIDAAGNRTEPLRPKANRWTRMNHLEVDSADALFVGGRTDSNLGGTYAVHGDAFVAKLTRVE